MPSGPTDYYDMAYVNESYQRQGQDGAQDFMRQSSAYCRRRLRRECSLLHVTTQEHKDADLRLL